MSAGVSSPSPLTGNTAADDTLKQKTRNASVVSGGDATAKVLKNEAVDTIFALGGGHIIDIYDGCADGGIRIVDARDEQLAAHAADGYARQSGKLGRVVTAAGPSRTNADTGIATAFRSKRAIPNTGGGGAQTQHEMGSLHDLPHVDIMAPITKVAASASNTERVADMISTAARERFNGAPGPQISGALQRARETIHRTGRPAMVNIWVDLRECAPGTKNRTLYK
jgi:acetolactate synthase-1/2/3 large subunit